MTTESAGIKIDRNGDSLTISMRTHRSGDFVHYVLGLLAAVFGVLVLWIGISNGTLLESWITIPLILLALGYSWFAATRAVNRRVLTISAGLMKVDDHPLFSLAPTFEMPITEVGKIEIRSERRWVPPIWWHEVSHVIAAGVPDVLFGNITNTEDASRIRAALVATLSGRRGGVSD